MSGDPQVGEVLTGEVTALTDYGLFFHTGRERVLVLLPDLCWERISLPSDSFEVGDVVEARLVHVGPEGELRASIRDLSPDPFLHPAPYRPGDITQGTTQRALDYGTFVRLRPGVTGLLSGVQLASGKEVQVEILEVDEGRRTLSLRLLES